MTLFILKPIMWNTEGYRQPSGVVVNANAFPGEHGFGHEEWNGSEAMRFEDEGVAYRAFHTEGVGNAPVEDNVGKTFVFLYASHDGVQELVGIAGNATSLIGQLGKRQELTKRLQLENLSNQAWSVPRVKSLHAGDRRAFNKVWADNLSWIPNWICPEEMFLWLDEPVTLNPENLRGTAKLLTMFSKHTLIDWQTAVKLLDCVPLKLQTPAWLRLETEIKGGAESLLEDLVLIENRNDLRATATKLLMNARLGQGKFRRDVERQWQEACSISGCCVREVLRASHIKPWRASTDQERLDGNNGLLLTADLDALFDRGLISFCGEGKMLVANRVPALERELLRLDRPLRLPPNKQQRRYLSDHRRRWGFDHDCVN